MFKPVLIFGYGNPSRGDDALGPLLLDNLQRRPAATFAQAEFLTDFQLQIEHALDLENRRLVLFADASVACTAPYEFSRVQAARDTSYCTHAMTPAAVLQAYQSVKKAVPPPCFLLSIRGEHFELGETLSAAAQINLRAALVFSERLLRGANLDTWRDLTGNARTFTA